MNIEDYMLSCTIKSTFGIECFGCGMQRALLLIFKGDFAAAFQMHPPVYSFLLFVVSLLIFIFKKSKITQNLVIGSAIFYAIFAVGAYTVKHVIN